MVQKRTSVFYNRHYEPGLLNDVCELMEWKVSKPYERIRWVYIDIFCHRFFSLLTFLNRTQQQHRPTFSCHTKIEKEKKEQYLWNIWIINIHTCHHKRRNIYKLLMKLQPKRSGQRWAMDKLVLCRLCLTNSNNTSFVSVTPEIELILQKYKIVFEVSKLMVAFFHPQFRIVRETLSLPPNLRCPHQFACIHFCLFSILFSVSSAA